MLVIVMVIALTLLFATKSFAERQQYATSPRQAARRAIDYLGIYTSGAGDLNSGNGPQDPLALLTYLNTSATVGASQQQVSFNNLRGDETTPTISNSIVSTGVSAFGDIGTDIITVVVPTSPVDIPISSASGGWPGFKSAGATIPVDFRAGCTSPVPVAGDNRRNLDLFKGRTGWDGTSATCCSGLVSVVDTNGLSTFYRITDYGDDGSTNPPGSTCANTVGIPTPVMGTADVVHPRMVPGISGTLVDTPGGHPELLNTPPPSIKAGIQIYSFRVKNGRLEQKLGPPFDDASSANAGFSPILDNVSDLQVAYLYGDGTFWNTGTTSPYKAAGNILFELTDNNTLNPTPNSPDGVPLQAGPCALASGCSLAPGPACDCAAFGPTALTTRDASLVKGLRISITGRSNPLPFAGRSITSGPSLITGLHVQPRSEDHPKPTTITYIPGTTPLYDYNRITTTLAIRNRVFE